MSRTISRSLREDRNVMKAMSGDMDEALTPTRVDQILRAGTAAERAELDKLLQTRGTSIAELSARLPFLDLDSSLYEVSTFIGFVQEHGEDPEWRKMTCKKILRDLRAAADTFEASLPK